MTKTRKISPAAFSVLLSVLLVRSGFMIYKKQSDHEPELAHRRDLLLSQYMKQDYRQAHLVIEFETEAGCAEYAVFAVVTVKKYDDWYGFIKAADRENFEKQLE